MDYANPGHKSTFNFKLQIQYIDGFEKPIQNHLR